MCNWEEFVYGQIHSKKLKMKKVGKVGEILHGHMFSVVVNMLKWAKTLSFKCKKPKKLSLQV
jgi:hypothetical protein